jgi:hypothetical protein
MKEARFHSMAISLLLLAVAGSMLVSSETTAEPALTLHVAVDGDDAAAGTAGEPLQSLPAAKQRVRDHLAQEPASDVLVILREGVYRLTEPLRFTAADNPAEGHTITWQAAENAHVRISGGRVIDNWELRDDGALVATLDEVAAGDWSFRELFVNGERRPRARYPSTGYARVAQVGEDRRTNFTFHAADIPEALDGDFTGRDLELVFFHEWSISRTPVASIDQSQARLNTSHPVGPLVLDFFVMDHWEPDPRYFLENHPALLTSPGEWYLDRDNGELTYLLEDGESADSIEVVAPVADGLIEVRGEPDAPVRGLIFRGLHFEHAGWSLPEGGYHGMQATFHDRRDGDEFWWRWRVPAAISFELAEHCAVEDGSVRRLGMAGVEFGSRTSHNRVVGNLIDDVAANGIQIGETNHRRIDGESWIHIGPEQAATANVIEDNLIQRVGVQFFGAVGIWVGMAADTEIRHNTIRQTPYSGISVGWQWTPDPTPCRGTQIEANHIHDVMQVLSDGGGVYTLGWQPDAVVRENLIHDVPLSLGRAESNGLFIDEGSKGLLIEENIIYDIGRSPLRFNRADRIHVRRNTLVLPDDQTPVFRFNATPEKNIDATDNEVVTADAFDPANVSDLRERVGPRIDHAGAPDPARTQW